MNTEYIILMRHSYILCFLLTVVILTGAITVATDNTSAAIDDSATFESFSESDMRLQTVDISHTTNELDDPGVTEVYVQLDGVYELGRYPHIIPVSVTVNSAGIESSTVVRLYPTESAKSVSDYNGEAKFVLQYQTEGPHNLDVTASILQTDQVFEANQLTVPVTGTADEKSVISSGEIQSESVSEAARSTQVPTQYRSTIDAERYLESRELPPGERSVVREFSNIQDITAGSTTVLSNGDNPVNITTSTNSISASPSQTLVIQYTPTGDDISLTPLKSSDTPVGEVYTLPSNPAGFAECHTSDTGKSIICIYRLSKRGSDNINVNNELILRYNTNAPDSFKIQCQQIISGGIEPTDTVCGMGSDRFVTDVPEPINAPEEDRSGIPPVALPGGPYQVGFERSGDGPTIQSIGVHTQRLTTAPNEEWNRISDSTGQTSIETFEVTIRNTPRENSVTTDERSNAWQLLKKQYGTRSGWTLSDVSVDNKVGTEVTYTLGKDNTPEGSGWEQVSSKDGVRQVLVEEDAKTAEFPSYNGPADIPGLNDREGTSWVVDYSVEPTTIAIVNATDVSTAGSPGPGWTRVDDNLGVETNKTGDTKTVAKLVDKLDITVDKDFRIYYAEGDYEYVQSTINKIEKVGYKQITTRTYYTYTSPDYAPLHKYERSIYDVVVTFERPVEGTQPMYMYEGPKYISTYTYNPESITFNGQDSFDPDDEIESYKWETQNEVYEEDKINGDTSQIKAEYEAIAESPEPFKNEFHTLYVTDTEGNIDDCTFEVTKQLGGKTSSLQPQITDIRVNGPVDVRTERIEILIESEGQVNKDWTFRASILNDGVVEYKTRIDQIEHIAGENETFRLLVSPDSGNFNDALGLSADDQAIEHTVVISATAPGDTTGCDTYVTSDQTTIELYTIECSAPYIDAGTDCPVDGYITSEKPYPEADYDWAARDSDKDGIINGNDICPYYIGDCKNDSTDELEWTESDTDLYTVDNNGRIILSLDNLGDFYRSCTFEEGETSIRCSSLSELIDNNELIKSSPDSQLSTVTNSPYSPIIPANRLFLSPAITREETTEGQSFDENLLIYYDFEKYEGSTVADRTNSVTIDATVKSSGNCGTVSRIVDSIPIVGRLVDCEVQTKSADEFIRTQESRFGGGSNGLNSVFEFPESTVHMTSVADSVNKDSFNRQLGDADVVTIKYRLRTIDTVQKPRGPVIAAGTTGLDGNIETVHKQQLKSKIDLFSSETDVRPECIKDVETDVPCAPTVGAGAPSISPGVSETLKTRHLIQSIDSAGTITSTEKDSSFASPTIKITDERTLRLDKPGSEWMCITTVVDADELIYTQAYPQTDPSDTDSDNRLIKNVKLLLTNIDETARVEDSDDVANSINSAQFSKLGTGSSLHTPVDLLTIGMQADDSLTVPKYLQGAQVDDIQVYAGSPNGDSRSSGFDCNPNVSVEELDTLQQDRLFEDEQTIGHVQMLEDPTVLDSHELIFQGDIINDGRIKATVLAVNKTAPITYDIIDQSDPMVFIREYDSVSQSIQPTDNRPITGLSTKADAYALAVKFQDVESMQTDVERFSVRNVSDPPVILPEFGPTAREPSIETSESSKAKTPISIIGSSSAGSYDDTTVPVVEHQYSFGDGISETVSVSDVEGGTRSTVSHQYQCAGKYNVQLTAIDERGNTDTASTVLTIDDIGLTVDTTRAVYTGDAEESIQFDASPSSGGDIIAYEWTFPDGTVRTGEVVSHTFDESGEYTVDLRVENKGCNVGFKQIDVTVDTAEPPITVAGDGRSYGTHDSCSTRNRDDDIRWIDVNTQGTNQLDISVKYNPRNTGSYTQRDGVNIKLWYHDESSGRFTEIASYIDDPTNVGRNQIYTYTWSVPSQYFGNGEGYIRAGIEDRASRSDEISGTCANGARYSHYDNADQRINLNQ